MFLIQFILCSLFEISQTLHVYIYFLFINSCTILLFAYMCLQLEEKCLTCQNANVQNIFWHRKKWDCIPKYIPDRNFHCNLLILFCLILNFQKWNKDSRATEKIVSLDLWYTYMSSVAGTCRRWCWRCHHRLPRYTYGHQCRSLLETYVISYHALLRFWNECLMIIVDVLLGILYYVTNKCWMKLTDFLCDSNKVTIPDFSRRFHTHCIALGIHNILFELFALVSQSRWVTSAFCFKRPKLEMCVLNIQHVRFLQFF